MRQGREDWQCVKAEGETVRKGGGQVAGCVGAAARSRQLSQAIKTFDA